MKFLLFPHCFYPAKEGGSTTFTNLALGLKENNQKVEVLTSNCPSSDYFFKKSYQNFIAGRNQHKGLEIFRLNTSKINQRFIVRLAKLTKLPFLAIIAKGPIFKNLGQIFKKRSVDWVIAGHFPLLTPFWALLVARRNQAKFAIIPGFHPDEKDHQNKSLIWLLRQSDAIFCCTKYEKNIYKKFGVDQNKIFVFGGLINNRIFNQNPENKGKFPKKPHVLYLGSKAIHKRINLLISAMCNIWQNGIEARLTIAGPETLSSKKIQIKIDQLPFKFRSKITYLKEVGEQEKIDLIDSATVLVNPSEYESFGNIFIESWARKKPVIAANLPALTQVIDDAANGFLFKKNSLDDLTQKIIKLIKDPKLAAEMGANGYYKAIRKFKREIVVGKIIDFIKNHEQK